MDIDLTFINSLRKIVFEKLETKCTKRKEFYEKSKIFTNSRTLGSFDKAAQYDFRLYRVLPDCYYFPSRELKDNITKSLEEVNVLDPYEYNSCNQLCTDDVREPSSNFRNSFDHNAYDSINSSSSKSIRVIQNWFPVYSNGICRILGQVEVKSTGVSKIVITGAILSYKESENLITTFEHQYKLAGERSMKYIETYIQTVHKSYLRNFSVLSGENWLENIVKLWSKLEIKNKLFQEWEALKIQYFHIKRIADQFLQFCLKSIKPKEILKNQTNELVGKKDYEYLDICEKLERIIKDCRNDTSWKKSLYDFLKKCGQKSDLLNKVNEIAFIDEEKCNSPFKIIDFDESKESLSYEDFSSGDKFNSTLANFEVKLVFWALMKNDQDQFLIKGLKLPQKGTVKYVPINPVVISSVSKCGLSVIAEKCKFELVGPMYENAILDCYPYSENTEYFHIFQYFFTTKIPDNWKEIICILHILAQCSHLRYSCDPLLMIQEEDTEIFKVPKDFEIKSKSNRVKKIKNIAKVIDSTKHNRDKSIKCDEGKVPGIIESKLNSGSPYIRERSSRSMTKNEKHQFPNCAQSPSNLAVSRSDRENQQKLNTAKVNEESHSKNLKKNISYAESFINRPYVRLETSSSEKNSQPIINLQHEYQINNANKDLTVENDWGLSLSRNPIINNENNNTKNVDCTANLIDLTSEENLAYNSGDSPVISNFLSVNNKEKSSKQSIDEVQLITRSKTNMSKEKHKKKFQDTTFSAGNTEKYCQTINSRKDKDLKSMASKSKLSGMEISIMMEVDQFSSNIKTCENNLESELRNKKKVKGKSKSKTVKAICPKKSSKIRKKSKKALTKTESKYSISRFPENKKSIIELDTRLSMKKSSKTILELGSSKRKALKKNKIMYKENTTIIPPVVKKVTSKIRNEEKPEWEEVNLSCHVRRAKHDAQTNLNCKNPHTKNPETLKMSKKRKFKKPEEKIENEKKSLKKKILDIALTNRSLYTLESHKLTKFVPINGNSSAHVIDDTGCFSNIIRTRSGRASLPRTDARTGISYEYEAGRVFLLKGTEKIMELEKG